MGLIDKLLGKEPETTEQMIDRAFNLLKPKMDKMTEDELDKATDYLFEKIAEYGADRGFCND
ncbi:hypothetical protein MmiEs2_04970 [Methanimicrococcus stummii]|uniref:Uncharacterized protein n=1 Tax=Methanimicrococcus stummii TaxID=3028294 RepID=A0AA96ZYN9_9EURY|nr:hypothetical protein [Methanimicrococcus sp. Es2]WNY28312.1 hypothetical protein MmiEs2_04970 [Methanimicrococcus sp. Es2]